MSLDDANSSPDSQIDQITALLMRARGFLERGWCRCAIARNVDGRRVKPTSQLAVAWCAYGALRAAGMPIRFFSIHPALRRLQAAIDGEHIITFGDRQETVEPVLAAFDRAIAAHSGGDISAPVGRAIAAGSNRRVGGS